MLPRLTVEEALEVTRIRSGTGQALPTAGLIDRPPLRAPGASASLVSLLGGGTSMVRPGEVSLAHRGVLFLDDAPSESRRWSSAARNGTAAA